MTDTKTRENEENTVMLTLSNSMDQTRKIRVRIPRGSTVQQAAREAGIFPDGAFDVYNAEGDTVTNEMVDIHRDATLYVGVQKVAGGNEPEMPLDPVRPQKSIMFVSAFDPEVRNAVIPTDDQTTREAAEMAGLGPRDGSAWQVYDTFGEIVGDRPAAELAGQSLYVGPPAIAAGAVTVSDLTKVRADFPSIATVAGFRRGELVDVIHLMMGDSRGRTTEGHYKCVVDLRGSIPGTHILNLRKGIKHPHVYTRSTVPGTSSKSHFVCQGNARKAISVAAGASQTLSSYLNHIASVLNS